MIFIIILFLIPAAVFAQDAGYQGINLQAPIGGLSKVNNLGEYIAGLYRYSIVLAGILAGIMVTVGGLKWLMAAGNASIIESAKKTIFGALVGLILVFTSYIILNTVNPQLVSLKVPTTRDVRREEFRVSIIRSTLPTCQGRTQESCNLPGCAWANNECIIILESGCDRLTSRAACEREAPGCGWLTEQNKCVAAAANSESLIIQRIDENSRECETKQSAVECELITGCLWTEREPAHCNATLERATGVTLCARATPRCPTGQKCIRQDYPVQGGFFEICSDGTTGAACNENNDCHGGLRCAGTICGR